MLLLIQCSLQWHLFNFRRKSEKMRIAFCFTLVSLYVSSDAFSSIVTENEAETLLQHGSNKCICSNNLVHKAPDHIGNGNEVERLIVYFYKNKITNEVFMYTPAKRTQYLFPDLSIEEGDDFLTINSETVQQVVRASNNFIRVSSHQSESGTKSEVVTEDSMAIGFNTGIMETTKLRPELVNELPHEDDNGKSDSIESNTSDNILHIENDNTVDKTNYGENMIIFPQIANINAQSVTKDYVSGKGVISSENSVNICSPENPHCNHLITSIHNDKFVWPWEKNIKDLQYTSNTDSASEKLVLDSKILDLIIQNEVKNKNYPKTNSIEKILERFLSLFRKPTTFDRWFDHQIHKLSNNSKQLENTIDIDYLKSKLENILFENHILTAKDGTHKSEHDVVLNTVNLRLHLISVGDIGTYKNLLKSNTFSLFPNLRYLNLIVVTQIVPPKLLGVIPLRKRCDSSYKSSYRRTMSNLPFYHPSLPLYHQPYNYYEHYPKQFHEYYSLPNLPRSKKNLRQKENQIKPVSSHSTQSLSPDKVLNTIKSLIDLRVGPVSLPDDLLDFFGSGNKRDKDLYNQGEVEFDDDIGIRIIGGNAATSSGTPLSSKGRSADIV